MLLLEHWQDGARLGPLLRGFKERGIEVLELDEKSKPRTDEALSLIAGGKVAFILSFNANSNVDSELFHRIRRKAVDLQVQVISTKEEAEALLLCVGD